MRLEVIISADELTALVRALSPVRIVLDEARGRTVTSNRPRVELVPGRGIRLEGDAKITWEAFGVPVPITIQSWRVLFTPWIAERGRAHVLGFEPTVEALDLKGVPSFVDGKIAEGIKGGIAKSRERLAWDFARALTKRIPFPSRVESHAALVFEVIGGDVKVTAHELRLAVDLLARAERRSAVAPSPKPASANAFAPPVSVR